MKMKNIKKILTLALVIVSVLAIAVPALAYTKTSVSGTRYITSADGGKVNVRTGPGTEYPKANIGQFVIGTKVTLNEAKDLNGKYWYDVVDQNGIGGWVKGTFLSRTDPTGGSGGGGTSSQYAWEIRYGTGELSTAGGNSTTQQIKNFQSDLKNLGYSLGISCCQEP